MSQPTTAQVIRVPNTLASKVGGRFGSIDPAAIARAEAALKSLSGNFAAWLDEEIAKLDLANQQILDEGPTIAAMDTLYLRAHDLKGLGTTYEYPLVSRIASSLCKLIEDKSKRGIASVPLVEAHIQGIKAAVRGQIKTDDHPVGAALIAELERKVTDFIAGG